MCFALDEVFLCTGPSELFIIWKTFIPGLDIQGGSAIGFLTPGRVGNNSVFESDATFVQTGTNNNSNARENITIWKWRRLRAILSHLTYSFTSLRRIPRIFSPDMNSRGWTAIYRSGTVVCVFCIIRGFNVSVAAEKMEPSCFVTFESERAYVWSAFQERNMGHTMWNIYLFDN